MEKKLQPLGIRKVNATRLFPVFSMLNHSEKPNKEIKFKNCILGQIQPVPLIFDPLPILGLNSKFNYTP